MDLNSFFYPKSVVIVGVSANPQKIGYLVLKNMFDQGYKGKIYLVNPKHSAILEQKVYPSIKDINDKIDLAIVALPAKMIIPYLDEIKSVGCQNAIVYAAGFKESGKEGKKLEEELIEKAEKFGITVLGPNCLGFINTSLGINATFLKGSSPAGNIGFISQSGALGSVMVDYYAGHQNLGFSHFVSLGNKAVIDETEVLDFLKNDKQTEVIGMYLEDVRIGQKFRKILTATCKVKPVVILKSGSTEEGSQAALSHTGGLVGDDDIYSAVFGQSGAIRANGFSEFLNLLRLFSFKRVPSSRSTLVLSNAGGLGVLLADDLIKNQLSLVTISEDTKEDLYRAFEEAKKITVHNPIDLLGDASAFDYERAIFSTLKEKNIGSVVVLLTPQANTEILKTAKVVAKAQRKIDKPIYPVFMGKKSMAKTLHFFEDNHIPYFKTYDGLPVALDKINTFLEWQKQASRRDSNLIQTLSVVANRPEIEKILITYQDQKIVNMQDSLDVISLSGIEGVNTSFASSISDLSHAMTQVSFPAVLKIASETITHKTEVRGVFSNIKSLDELYFSFRKIMQNQEARGCYVQPMALGYELLLGAKRDPVFGPVILLGMGGIFAELLKEAVYFVYPFSFDCFQKTLIKSKFAKLISGFRGKPPLAVQPLYEVAMKLGVLLEKVTEIKEIDINPLFVQGSTIKAADSRIILQ
ncbi:hypothetical protein A3F03_00200 [Candidatus Roizmanbacteria bacterium RIFCSPHIGHO2_12_FULL_41_11]|uniref:CoA-binding domain-containing protein n=3 Tax=Candidatus Roizmaniibacteriota TaxID=1752723 RepID=A0A1F7J9V5_9BACT|nr:MAG: hypothetical protein A3F03_00200 [Candidatus Roizmanbacteria bacterium RIFCSPHIGHO2_12_FULL_41_11]OGK52387.1 MAG: hypothetical protein A2966_01830 [Candidatus Roizmanbacteria bacterium RIFCSPLOWO2_01_FULL_41_22]